MGLFSRSREYLEGEAMRDNPALLKQYLAQEQANQMAKLADYVYGQQGQSAVPAQYEQQMQQAEGPMMPGQQRPSGMVNQQTADAQAAVPGTGMFDQGKPLQERMMGMNKRMLGTGLQGFNKQWAGNQGNMQNSNMSNLGAMARQEQAQQYKTANPTETSGMKEYQLYRQQGGTLPWYEYKKNLNKAGAVNLGGTQYTSPAEAKNLEYLDGKPVAPFTDKNTLAGRVRAKTPMTAEEAKQQASAEVSIKMAKDLLGMLESGMDLSGFEGWAEGERAGAGLSNIALDTALNTFGYTSDPQNVKGVAIAENLSNTVLQALRGAAVGPAEQERVDKQLPRPGQPLEVFRQNILLTIENLNMIQKSKQKSRGTSNLSINAFEDPAKEAAYQAWRKNNP